MNAKPYTVAPTGTPCGWQNQGTACKSHRDAVHILTKSLPVAPEGTALCAYHSPFDVVPGETELADGPVSSARGPWSPGAYTVIFRNGQGNIRRTTCAIIPGYSTVADIPKMITIKYGDACEVLATMAMGMDTALLSSVLASLTGLRD